MTKISKPHPIPDAASQDERFREIACRALTPPDVPFDGLHIEAALLLNQLSPAADTCPPFEESRRRTPRDHQVRPERRVI